MRLLGSTARGSSDKESDIDLLVELEPGRTLFDLGGLLLELQRATGVRVDVAIDRMLRPEVRLKVKREAIPLRGTMLRGFVILFAGSISFSRRRRFSR